MTDFVEPRVIEEAELESITEDQTIGILRPSDEQTVRGDCQFDLHLLRRAIFAFEEEFDLSNAELALVRSESDGPPWLALTEPEGADRAIILPPRVGPQSPTTADELLPEGSA